MNAAEKAAAEALAKAQQQAQMAQMANQRIERVRQQAFAQAFNETLVNLVNAQIRLQAELAVKNAEIEELSQKIINLEQHARLTQQPKAASTQVIPPGLGIAGVPTPRKPRQTRKVRALSEPLPPPIPPLELSKTGRLDKLYITA